MALIAASLVMVVATAAVPADQGTCPEAATLEDFQAAARAGERAFANIDLPALTRAREVALATIPCLGDPVAPKIAAEFHRMMAMAAFTAGDELLVIAEFHAARRLDPGYAVPADVAPSGHPLVLLYEASALHDDSRDLESVIPPVDGTVVVDGTVDGLRPRGLSSIVQVYAADGLLTHTQYLLPGDPTPRFGPIPVDATRNRKRHRDMLISTGAVGLAAGALLTRARIGEQQVLDPSRDLPRPKQAQAINNSYYWGAVGVGAVAAGLGVYTVVTW